ncbi:MAG TPA: hypothetical protein VIJ39_03495 [Solirubrobacteraceae bacterium]
MPYANTRSRRPAAAALLILLLACVSLAACGGSSSTSSSSNAAATGTSSSGTSSTGTSSTGTSSTGSSTATPGNGRGTARFAAMRECLQKNGITLPKRTPGSTRPPAGTSRLGLPKGVSAAQYEAAVKKCGGGRFAGGSGAHRLNSPVFKAALAKYATCLRQNGINVPAPNTSGGGPIFNTKGINTTSSQFKTASKKCRTALVGAFRRPPGAPGAGGAPPAGGAPSGGAPTGGEGSAAGGESSAG